MGAHIGVWGTLPHYQGIYIYAPAATFCASCTWANTSVCQGAGGKAAEAPCVALSPPFIGERPLANTVAISMKPLNSALWRSNTREIGRGGSGQASQSYISPEASARGFRYAPESRALPNVPTALGSCGCSLLESAMQDLNQEVRSSTNNSKHGRIQSSRSRV